MGTHIGPATAGNGAERPRNTKNRAPPGPGNPAVAPRLTRKKTLTRGDTRPRVHNSQDLTPPKKEEAIPPSAAARVDPKGGGLSDTSPTEKGKPRSHGESYSTNKRSRRARGWRGSRSSKFLSQEKKKNNLSLPVCGEGCEPDRSCTSIEASCRKPEANGMAYVNHTVI